MALRRMVLVLMRTDQSRMRSDLTPFDDVKKGERDLGYIAIFCILGCSTLFYGHVFVVDMC